MEKPVNILSIIEASNELEPDAFEKYKIQQGFNIKKSELVDMLALVKKIHRYKKNTRDNRTIYNDFFVGFSIKQISREFDLLRIGEDYIINIELKRQASDDKIKAQLLKNKHYLGALGKPLYLFTYIAMDDRLVLLSEDDSLEDVEIALIVEKIENQVCSTLKNINDLFNPTEYLISPFNNTERFMNNEYFLTDQQMEFKNIMLKQMAVNGIHHFFSIYGLAGTGKTLLTYDIAKECLNRSKKVAIIHCGKLNDGQMTLKEKYQWNVFSIKRYKDVLADKYDVIILDEVQRVYKSQLDEIIDYVYEEKITGIFSYDPNQTLSEFETNAKIPEHIDEKANPKKFELTKKIRTNKELSSFIQGLFDSSKKNSVLDYSNVNLQYFSYMESTKGFIKSLKRQGWTVIDYTVPQYNGAEIYKMHTGEAEANTHEVIGQEYDNVVVVIGSAFWYSKDGKLMSSRSLHYSPIKMLLQIVTRARKKLCIVVVNNPSVFQKCLDLF